MTYTRQSLTAISAFDHELLCSWLSLRLVMERRTFMRYLGGAVAYRSLALRTAHARSPPTPVVGFLSALARELETSLDAFRRSLDEAGFREGQTVSVEYRWAEDHYERLPTLADELVHLGPAVIVAPNYPAAAAAKRATKTIPVVFLSGVDPVTAGLVESLNRPNSNATGIYILEGLLEAKRLETLHQVVPGSDLIGVLVNPNFPGVERRISNIRAASRELGISPLIVQISSENDLPGIFGTLAARKIGGLVVATDPFLYAHREDLVELAARYRVPAIYPFVEFVQLGGLMSHGADRPAAFHQIGVYAGQILKGKKPADLPVQQSTNVVLTLNLKTAKTLGITFPEALQGRADEVIE
jgi:putative tryptophan/tyrosine transport system substrate-binding protein